MMKKLLNSKALWVLGYIILLCALCALFAYLEWPIMLTNTILLGPLFLIPAFEKVLIRVAALFITWAVLITIFVIYISEFSKVIIVSGPQTYEVKHIRKGTVFYYQGSNNESDSMIVDGLCVCNQIDQPLCLYEVYYSSSMIVGGGPGEKELMPIPPHSMMAIPRYPDYILESPPESITVSKRNVFSSSTVGQSKVVLGTSGKHLYLINSKSILENPPF